MRSTTSATWKSRISWENRLTGFHSPHKSGCPLSCTSFSSRSLLSSISARSACFLPSLVPSSKLRPARARARSHLRTKRGPAPFSRQKKKTKVPDPRVHRRAVQTKGRLRPRSPARPLLISDFFGDLYLVFYLAVLLDSELSPHSAYLTNKAVGKT